MGAFRDWYEKIWGFQGQVVSAERFIKDTPNIEVLESYWKDLPQNVQANATVKTAYLAQKKIVGPIHAGLENPLKPVILNLLTDWKKKLEKYDLDDPKDADKKLAGLAADVLAMSATAAAVELSLGAFPNDLGTVASMKVSDLMTWLGFGAVLTAVAHDPVKIGLLRPYQDSLEAHFRNRRPDDNFLFQAYRTRELSDQKVPNVDNITDKIMDDIEAQNDRVFYREIAKWGYSEYFAGCLSRSATRTLNFSQLSALARQGILTRGMAIYSLWGEGLDRLVMRPALDALMQQNRIANYEGFRAQIEPAYIEGIVSEADLTDYWSKINVPEDVQAAMLPRFRKKKEAYDKKQKDSPTAKERDLTVSQVQTAYLNNLIDRTKAQNMILSMGYSQDETKVLLDMADMRRKLPGATNLKRLPLSDYEKAYKNGIIEIDQVLDRMRGEYTDYDIGLERSLLKSGKA